MYANLGNESWMAQQYLQKEKNASGIGKLEYDVPTGYTALSTKGLNE